MGMAFVNKAHRKNTHKEQGKSVINISFVTRAVLKAVL